MFSLSRLTSSVVTFILQQQQNSLPRAAVIARRHIRISSASVVLLLGMTASAAALTTAVGATSATQTATVTIAAAGKLNTISVVTQGATGLDFNPAPGGTCSVGTTYAANATCTVSYTFSPKAPGSRLGAVLLYDNSSTPVLMSTAYIAGVGSGAQGLFAPGTSATVASGFNGPRGVSVDASGNIYFSDAGNGNVDKIAAGTGVVTTLASGLNGPNGTTVDGAGNLFFGSSNGINEIPGGVAGITPVQVATGWSPDNVLLSDGAGNLYSPDYNSGSIFEVTAGTFAVTELYKGTSGFRFIGMAIDASGNLFAADFNGSTGIYELAVGSNALTLVVPNSVGGFANPHGLEIDPAGNFYTTNYSGNGDVQKYMPLAGGGYSDIDLPTGNAYYGIAFDPAGNLLVLNGNQVTRYTRAASPSLSFGNLPTPPGTSADIIEGLENDGNANLTIAAIATSASFALNTTDTTCPVGTLVIGATCNLAASFSPATVGYYNGYLNVTDNSLSLTTTNTQRIPLTGNAGQTKTIAFTALASPATVATAATLVATASNGDPVTFKVDSGPATIVGTTINYLGTGTVVIEADSAQTTTYLAATPVTQTVLVGAAVGSPAGTPQFATVTIATAGTLNANAISVVTQGIAGLDFKLTSGGTCITKAYTVSQTCTVAYTFTATQIGQRLGAVLVYSNASTPVLMGETFLSATGIGPIAAFTSGTSSAFLTPIAGNSVQAIVFDAAGNCYVSVANQVLRYNQCTGTGSSLTGPGGSFNGPQQLAIDGAGTLYVADASQIVEVFNPSTGTGTSIAIGRTQNIYTHGIVVDAAGNAYFDDYNNGDRVAEIAAGTQTITTLVTGLAQGFQMAIDGTGDLFVADNNGGALYEIFPGSGTLTRVTTNGLIYPYVYGVALDAAGHIYVNAYNNSVVLPVSGGNALGSLLIPSTYTGLTVGPNDSIYYFVNDTIYVISRTQGTTLTFSATAVGSTSAPQFESFENDGNAALTISGSSATTNFVLATSTTAPCSGTLVAGAVCSFGAEFAPTVAFTGEEGGTATLTDNSQGTNGSTQTIPLVGTSPLIFAATNVGSSTASTLTLSFTSATTLNSNPDIAIQVLTQGAPNLDFTLASGGTCAAGVSYPAGGSCTVKVKFSPLFPGSRLGGVDLYDNSATPVMVQSFYVSGLGNAPLGVIYPGTSTVAFNGFSTAFEVATDAARNVYVSDYGADAIYQYTPISGGYTQKHITNAIGQVAVDGLGNIYVADPYNYRILKETPSGGGNYNETTVLSYSSGTYYQWAVTVDRIGNLFVTDNSGFIYKETLAGSTYNQTNISNVYHGLITQLAVDATGNLFATDAGDGTVFEYVYNSTTGTYTEITVANNLSNTNGIAIDAAGDLYVANSGQGQILKLIPQLGGGYTQTVLLNGVSLNGVALDQSGNVYYSDGGGNVSKIDVVDPQTLTFPTTAIGVTSPAQTVTLDNIGNLPLTISADVVSGSTYALNGASTTCSTTPLITTGMCNIGVTFTPAIQGTAAGTLTITDNTLAVIGTNQLVNLSGYSPVTPTQVVVTTNSPALVTSNIVAIASIANSAGAVDMASGDTLNFALTGPTGFTAVNGTITVNNGVATYNFGNLPVGTYALTVSDTTTALTNGTATIIVVPVNYTSAAPTTAVASTSATQSATVTIDTAGTISTTLGTAIQVLTQGAAGLDFAYVTGGTCAAGTVYTTGQTCTVKYSFTPQYAGQRIGAIVLSSGSTALGTTYLSGIGTGPEVLFQSGVVSYSGSNLSTNINNSAALDGVGNLYTFDSNNNIVKITPAGVQSILAPGLPANYNGQVYGPGSLAVDGAGNIFFTENLYSYNTSNYVAPLLEIPVGTTTPIILTNLNSGSYGGYDAGGYNLVIDGAGNLYASSQYSGQITEIAAGTYAQTVLAPSPSTQVGGMTVDSAGNVWFTETYNQTVEEIVAGSGTTTQIISGGSIYYPTGIAIDPAGDLYVASYYGSSIYRYAAGTFNATQIVASSNAAQYRTWLKLDGAGNLYFGNAQSNYQSVGIAGKLQRTSIAALTYSGNNQVGSTSGAQTVTLENDGTSAATISSLATTYATLTTGTGACSTTTSVASGSTCTLGIKFTPTAVGSPLSGSVVVTDNSLNVSTSTQIVNISGNSILTPSQIVLSTITTPITAGSNLGTITGIIENSYGYTATASSASVTFKLTGPTGFTTLSYTDTASSGVATQSFASTSLTVAGTYTLTATSSSLSTATKTIVVNPGTPTTLTQTGGPTGQINAGGTIGPIQGTLMDTYGNVATNSTATISYSLTGPSGFTTLTGSVTASSGVATFFSPSSAALNTPGNYTLTLTSGSLSSTPDTFLVGQITPVVAASVTSPITYGTSLSSLTATATYNGTAVPGSFIYTATPTGGTAVAVTTSTVLGAGTYIITATFNPTNTLTYKSPSTTASLVVNKAATTISIKASASTINPNQTVTLTATVLSTTIGVPTLTVTFFDNGTALPAATLSSGSATLTTLLSPGITHIITATYNGDPNFLTSSTTTTASIVVNPLDFTFVDTGSSAYTVVPGKVATYSFLLSPLYGTYPTTVSFSVAGLPTGATATFTPSTVTVSGGTQSVVMSIQTPAPIGFNQAPDPFGTNRLPLVALLLLPIGFSRKLRKKLGSRILMLLLLVAGLAGTAALTGCGGNGNGFLLQQPATYSLTVTATSGTLQHSQLVTLTVQ